MLQGVLPVAAVVLAVAIVPAIVLVVTFRLIDYVADDDSVTDRGRASGDGNLSGDATATPGTGWAETQSAESPSRADPDVDPGEWSPTAAETVTCPECDADNDAEYDRCWNCLSSL